MAAPPRATAFLAGTAFATAALERASFLLAPAAAGGPLKAQQLCLDATPARERSGEDARGPTTPDDGCNEIVALSPGREKGMIGRVWHGWASAENADACEALLKSEMLPGPVPRIVPGFERVELSRSDFEDEVEFMVIMWFASWEAIKAFAGEEFERARVPASVRALLSRFDERSQHYEIRIQESA